MQSVLTVADKQILARFCGV